MRTYTIYTLSDPRTGLVRYVGQTNRPPARRLGQHIQTARKSTVLWVSAWIRGLLNDGLLPIIATVETAASEAAADEAEVGWIVRLREQGCTLLNRAAGGCGNRGWNHSAEQREKWKRERRGDKAARYGDPKSPVERARISAALKVTWATKGHPRTGVAHTPATLAKIAEARLRNPPILSAEGRAAVSEATKRRWQDPEWRERFSAMMGGAGNPNAGKPMLPHVKAAIIAGNNKRRGIPLSEEHRDKLRIAALAREARKRTAQRHQKELT
jgi:hypothetical protein